MTYNVFSGTLNPTQSINQSSVTLVHPSQPVEIIGNISTPLAIWYIGHSLTSTEIFTKIVPGEPRRRERGLNARGVAEYSEFGLIEGYLSEMVQDKR